MNLAKQIIADQIQICQEPKKRRRCQESCQDHLFALSPLEKQKKSYEVEVNFCPKFSRGNQPPQSTYPSYNCDQLHYTSSFVLGVDQKISDQSRKQEYIQHQKKMKIANEKNCKVMFPKPNSKHTICSVCKVNYDNHYYAHILGDFHKKHIKHSQYNSYILELTHKFKDLHPGSDVELSSPFQFPNYIIKRLEEGYQLCPIEMNYLPNIGQKKGQYPFFYQDHQNDEDENQPRRRRGKKSTKHQILTFSRSNNQIQSQSLQVKRPRGRGRPRKRIRVEDNEKLQKIKQIWSTDKNSNHPKENPKQNEENEINKQKQKKLNDILPSIEEGEIEEEQSETIQVKLKEKNNQNNEFQTQKQLIQLSLHVEQLMIEESSVDLSNLDQYQSISALQSSKTETLHSSDNLEKEGKNMLIENQMKQKKQKQTLQEKLKISQKYGMSLQNLIQKRVMERLKFSEKKQPEEDPPLKNEEIAKSTVGSENNDSLQVQQQEKILIDLEQEISENIKQKSSRSSKEQKEWKIHFKKFMGQEDKSIRLKRVMTFESPLQSSYKKIVLNNGNEIRTKREAFFELQTRKNNSIINVDSDSNHEENDELIDWNFQVKKASGKEKIIEKKTEVLMTREQFIRLSQSWALL